MQFEINGVEYQARPDKYENINSFTYTLIQDYNNKQYRSISKVNLIIEFERIQNKQSKLSRMQRDLVVRKFNSLFEIIK